MSAPLISDPAGRTRLGGEYRSRLLGDVIPFWLRHGFDREHGGFITGLARDGEIIDTDKPVWAQGRGAWMLATLLAGVPDAPSDTAGAWREAMERTLDFLKRHAFAEDGKMFFLLTRDGRPVRRRRYVYSEAFAAIAFAAHARLTGSEESAGLAMRLLSRFVDFSFRPGRIEPKQLPGARPVRALAPLMIAIATAQEIRSCLGDVTVEGRSCSERIREWITEIARDFFKPDLEALMENVGPDGGIVDHFEGRVLNPGHAIEAAWFILREAETLGDPDFVRLGCVILDAMWERGWDPEYGGLFHLRDVFGRPSQEPSHDMKFWWPHCEALVATAWAWRLTGDRRHAERQARVHEWAFAHFADPDFGEWFGYLHQDGTPASTLKGNHWKGPFHVPRMLWVCSRILEDDGGPPGVSP